MGLFGKRRKPEADADITLSAQAENPERSYRAVDVSVIPAGPDSVLVSVPDGPAAVQLRFFGECLARCTVCRTLREHANRIGEELGLPESDRLDVLRELRRAAGSGFLLPFPLSENVEQPSAGGNRTLNNESASRTTSVISPSCLRRAAIPSVPSTRE